MIRTPEEFLREHRYRFTEDWRFTGEELCDFALGAGYTQDQARTLITQLISRCAMRRTARGLWGVMARNGQLFNNTIYDMWGMKAPEEQEDDA